MDRVQGKVKEVAGNLIGDEALTREGELHQEKADAEAEAARLAAEAEQAETEAEVVARERELAVEARELEAEEAAAARDERLERERAEEELRIDREHAAARKRSSRPRKRSWPRSIATKRQRSRAGVPPSGGRGPRGRSGARTCDRSGAGPIHERRIEGKPDMTITRTVVRTWLKTARLPITLAESTLHRGEHTEEWPPALAFGAFESGVKQVVGALVRDQELANEGRLERAQVTQLRKAAELDAIAEAREAEADAELRARQEADAQRAKAIEAEARSASRGRSAPARRGEASGRGEGAAQRGCRPEGGSRDREGGAEGGPFRSVHPRRRRTQGGREEAQRGRREEDGQAGRQEAGDDEVGAPFRQLLVGESEARQAPHRRRARRSSQSDELRIRIGPRHGRFGSITDRRWRISTDCCRARVRTTSRTGSSRDRQDDPPIARATSDGQIVRSGAR